MHSSRRFRLLSFGSMVLAGIALAVGSLTYTDRPARAQTPDEDIMASVEAAVAAWNAEDFESFVSFFTAEGLEDFFGIGPDDDAAALAAEDFEFTGPIATFAVTDLFVTSGNATGTVDIQFESGFSVFEEWSFIFLDGDWKMTGTELIPEPIPEGVPVVDMFLQEYAFVYNEDAIAAADGNVAFQAFNVGQEDHEIVLVRNETGMSILEVLQAAGPEAEGPPPGIIDVAVAGPIGPGQETAVVLDQPLSPGTYGLLCFVPAPDGTPHAFLGMVSEFNIGALAPDDDDGVAPIRPPSTGDAGLLGTGAGTLAWLMLGVALTLVLGGTAGLVVSRRSTGT